MSVGGWGGGGAGKQYLQGTGQPVGNFCVLCASFVGSTPCREQIAPGQLIPEFRLCLQGTKKCLLLLNVKTAAVDNFPRVQRFRV